MKQDCPVCGNELVVNPRADKFRCKYCRRLVKVNVHPYKGRCHVELEECEEDRSSSRPFMRGLEADRG